MIKQIKEKFPDILLELRNMRHKSDFMNNLNLTDIQKEVLKNHIESKEFKQDYKKGQWTSFDSDRFISENNLNITKQDLEELFNNYFPRKNFFKKISPYITILAAVSTIAIFIFFLYDRFSDVNNSKKNVLSGKPVPLIKSDTTKINLDTTQIIAKPDIINKKLLQTNRDTTLKVLTK